MPRLRASRRHALPLHEHPPRYATGYLGDIGVPKDPAPMDFSAWFEVYLGGRWHTFDARHNHPRIGRIVIARRRDASDVALTTVFGSHMLKSFKVWTDEVEEPQAPDPIFLTPSAIQRCCRSHPRWSQFERDFGLDQ